MLQRTACLVVGPVAVSDFAFHFDCTPVGRTSDSVAVPAWGLVCWLDGVGLVLWLFVGPAGFCPLDFFSSDVRFCLLLSSCLCFISLLCLGLCVLGDDALVGWGPFRLAWCLCVWIRIWAGVGLARCKTGLSHQVK